MLLFVCVARRSLCGVCGSSCIVVSMLVDACCSLLVVGWLLSVVVV